MKRWFFATTRGDEGERDGGREREREMEGESLRQGRDEGRERDGGRERWRERV